MSATDAAFPEALPSWFVVGLTTALAVVVGFGAVGLALADGGVFTPLATFLLGGVLTVALVALVAPWRLPARGDRAANVPAGLAVALAIAATAFALQHRAQHVLVDRDPGVYSDTARWMATHHNLAFRDPLATYRSARVLFFLSAGVYDRGGGHLTFQFSHLLPTLMAETRWIGGDGLMFCLPPILGGIGLLCFYALATRFVAPWIALAATAALACDLVEVHFMRDAYSELPTQVMLLGGLWLLTRRGPPRPAVAGFSGVLLGATVMARVDGPLYLIAVPLALGTAMVAHRRGDAGSRAQVVAAAWLVAGAAVTATLGYVDVHLRSPQYVRSLGNRVLLEYVGLAIVCVLIVVAAAWARRPIAWVERARTWLPDTGLALVGAVLLAMWFIRPHIQRAVTPYPHRTAAVNAQFAFYGIIRAGIRTHAEASVVWHSWYLGPVALAAGIAGIALLTREVLRGTAGPNGFVVVSFLAVGAVYLWKPNVLPDHIWVMRRFLPFILPGFVLFGFVVVDRLLGARGRSTRALAARAAGIVLLCLAIAWPVASVWPVRNDTSQHGFLAAIDRVCAALPPSAAVVILQGGRLDQVLPQALRSYCDVPVAIGASEKTTVFPLNDLRADFVHEPAATRHTLFVAADSIERIDNIFPLLEPVAIVTARNSRVLEKTISRRPDRLVDESYRIVIAKVPAPHRS